MAVSGNQPYGVALPFIADSAYTLFKNQYTSSGSSPGGGSPGSGTVTSVGLALPVSVFNVSGSPVSASGTLTGSFISQTANTFLAAPNGAPGVPSFRALVPADLPAGAGSPLTTKGDLYTFSTVNTRLGVGTNNYMLTPDSAQTTGLKWANPLTIIPVFVGSGASHAIGFVPDPGSTAGTTKFLREDATWAVPSGGGGSGGANLAYVFFV